MIAVEVGRICIGKADDTITVVAGHFAIYSSAQSYDDEALLADKSYMVTSFRGNLPMHGILPIIPPKSNHRELIRYDLLPGSQPHRLGRRDTAMASDDAILFIDKHGIGKPWDTKAENIPLRPRKRPRVSRGLFECPTTSMIGVRSRGQQRQDQAVPDERYSFLLCQTPQQTSWRQV